MTYEFHDDLIAQFLRRRLNLNPYKFVYLQVISEEEEVRNSTFSNLHHRHLETILLNSTLSTAKKKHNVHFCGNAKVSEVRYRRQKHCRFSSPLKTIYGTECHDMLWPQLTDNA
jgi:hypothetical protein